VGSPVGRWEDGEALVEDFIGWLAARGRSSYTQRSYWLGAAHFLRWVAAQGIEPDAVGQAEAIDYVAEFRRGEPGSEGRAGRTVNHRVSVLSTLFEFWAEREPERGADREPPVPPASSAMDGSHGMPGRDAIRRRGRTTRVANSH
jgi:site-specific recombinase XerD